MRLLLVVLAPRQFAVKMEGGNTFGFQGAQFVRWQGRLFGTCVQWVCESGSSLCWAWAVSLDLSGKAVAAIALLCQNPTAPSLSLPQCCLLAQTFSHMDKGQAVA